MNDDCPQRKGVPSRQCQSSPAGVTILELRLFSCRYIIGSDEDVGAIFCGDTARRPPYCRVHREICYKRPPLTPPPKPQRGR